MGFDKIFESNDHSKLAKYTKVTDLKANLRLFSQMKSIHNVPLSKDIRSLTISNGGSDEMETFLTSNCIDFECIQILKVHLYAMHRGPFSHLLNFFQNIKFLELNINPSNQMLNIFDDYKFKDGILNHLEGLCLYGSSIVNTRFYDHLLHHYSHKLLSLHIDAVIESPKHGFSKLEELCIGDANSDKIKNILKTAKTLKRIHLYFRHDMIKNDDALEDILVELLSQVSLEFISIKIDGDISKMNNVFEKIRFQKRKRLKIKFYAKSWNCEEHQIKYYKAKIKSCGADDWMLIFLFPNSKKQKRVNRTFINNKKCKINGYKEKWLYPCICQGA